MRRLEALQIHQYGAGWLWLRLHASFLACAVVVVYLCGMSEAPHVAQLSLLGLGILLASVLLHELGHVMAAVHFGGRVERLVIGPFGGLVLPSVPPQPQRKVMVALAGPAMNFLVLLLAAQRWPWPASICVTCCSRR